MRIIKLSILFSLLTTVSVDCVTSEACDGVLASASAISSGVFSVAFGKMFLMHPKKNLLAFPATVITTFLTVSALKVANKDYKKLRKQL